jgi:hypothetical protein
MDLVVMIGWVVSLMIMRMITMSARRMVIHRPTAAILDGFVPYSNVVFTVVGLVDILRRTQYSLEPQGR